ncbi:MAG: protein kinase, partial [Acidobacteriota bacterium]
MIGTRLADRYELLSEFGRGGMAVVYRARDPRLDREVAIKLIAAERLAPQVAERFQREAELIAGLDHPAIVPVYDFGRDGRWLFLVMPVLQGANLHQLMRHRRLLLDTTLEIAAQAAEALAYSADRGIIHRDVKPENVMVALDGDDRLERLWVMDFGLAVGDMSTRLTRTGNLPGTLAYLSPEQIITGEVDGRSDLYSLGVILYECLAGRPPFTGSPASVLYRIVHEEPAGLVPHGVDERLEAVVLRCLAKGPQDRFDGGAALAAELRHFMRYSRGGDPERLPRAASQKDGEVLPLVGRDREQSQIDGALEHALDGSCQLMLVGGERGLGTSRLASETQDLARRRGFQVLRGRFSSQAGGVSYEAFGELIFDFFTQRRSSTSVGGLPLPSLDDLGPELQRLFPVLREIPELGGGASPAEESAVRGPSFTAAAAGGKVEEPRHIFELIARTLSRLGGQRPQALVIEQLQEADVSIQLLLYLVRRLGSTRTFILGTYRPSGTSRSHPLKRLLRGLRGDPRCHHLELEPLGRDHHRELLEHLLGGGSLEARVSDQLYEVTGGNPLFAQEVVRSLWDAGDLELDASGRWQLADKDVLSRELPDTVQQAVVARIERLGERALDVLGTASVLGRRFHYRDLEELWPGDGSDELDESVEVLLQRHLLSE